MKKTISIILTTFVVMSVFVSCKDYKEKKAIRDREIFVADSIAKREKEIADSIEIREKFVADSIAEIQRIDKIKNSIRLTSYYLSSANSAGGRDVHFNYQNLSDKTIKYLSFKVSFYNAVGDPAFCEIRDRCTFTGRDTGPIKPNGYGSDGYWDCVIYNYQAKKMELNQIEIEYMDGSTLRIGEGDLKYVKGYKG